MLRLLCYINIMLLVACGTGFYYKGRPKFAVGDCIVSDSVVESWETAPRPAKIVEVGKASYRMKRRNMYDSNIISESAWQIWLVDQTNIKVECPSNLKEIK